MNNIETSVNELLTSDILWEKLTPCESMLTQKILALKVFEKLIPPNPTLNWEQKKLTFMLEHVSKEFVSIPPLYFNKMNEAPTVKMLRYDISANSN